MIDYAAHFRTRNVITPQSEPIPGSAQVQNSAGGYVWAVDDWKRLDRFLVLGTEGGSYYASERILTRENAGAIERCLKADGRRTVDRIVEVSQAGRAPKNDPALFALAMCAGLGNDTTVRLALLALPQVARIGTHLFHFAQFVEGFRGWGRGLRSAIGRWYTEKTPDALAYQAIKYQGRDGWTHKDLLRLAHPNAPTPAHAALFRWLIAGRDGLGERTITRGPKAAPRPWVYGAVESDSLPPILAAFEEAQTADGNRLVQLIQEYSLPMEVVPTEKRTPQVYEALLPHAGLTWLFRNLGNLSKCGLLTRGAWDRIKVVTTRMTNAEELKRARVHPIQVLAALATYGGGHGIRGKGEWPVVPEVLDAADQAFYLAFGAVEPAGKRTVLGLDISGSMGRAQINGIPNLTARTASSAMAMLALKTEPRCTTIAFTDHPTEIDLSKYRRLDDVCKYTDSLPMGGTDCSLPMVWARNKKIEVDTFIVYTDSETWAGKVHPTQALQQYRREMGIPARLAVVGMCSNGFTIADPNDSGMMDCVGFDTAAPNVLAAFSRGDV